MSFTFSLTIMLLPFNHINLHTWTAEKRNMPRKSARAYDIQCVYWFRVTFTSTPFLNFR